MFTEIRHEQTPKQERRGLPKAFAWSTYGRLLPCIRLSITACCLGRGTSRSPLPATQHLHDCPFIPCSDNPLRSLTCVVLRHRVILLHRCTRRCLQRCNRTHDSRGRKDKMSRRTRHTCSGHHGRLENPQLRLLQQQQRNADALCFQKQRPSVCLRGWLEWFEPISHSVCPRFAPVRLNPWIIFHNKVMTPLVAGIPLNSFHTTCPPTSVGGGILRNPASDVPRNALVASTLLPSQRNEWLLTRTCPPRISDIQAASPEPQLCSLQTCGVASGGSFTVKS